MGNFHCISSSCATVVWRSYSPPSVRWRYEEQENWQTIAGDDYSIKNKIGQCPARYDLEYIVYSNNQPFQRIKTGIFGKIQSIYLAGGHLYVRQGLSGNPDANYIRLIDGGGTYSSFEIVSLKKQDGEPDNCGDCTFRVFNKDDIVFENITNPQIGCPEVEILPCRLSKERKQIKIDKIPYLERVEVVPYAYQNLGLAVYQANIPDECLNIYKNETATVIPQFKGFPTPTNSAQSTYGYITQICSPPGCPPPEYEVICDCNDCESCPENTCAVECDGNICCYDKTTGKSIKSIPIADYCGA